MSSPSSTNSTRSWSGAQTRAPQVHRREHLHLDIFDSHEALAPNRYVPGPIRRENVAIAGVPYWWKLFVRTRNLIEGS